MATDDETQTAPAPAPALPPGVTPDQLEALAQRYMPQLPQRDTTPVSRSWTSLLGEAVGGGAPVGGMTPAEQELAGNRALMNFGTGLMAASHYQPGQTIFSNLAQGFQGAQRGEIGSAQLSMSQLGAQQDWALKQQQAHLEALKTALPFLQLQQFGAARDLALGNKPAGTGLAATGAPIATGSGVAPSDMVGSIASTLNIPTADAAAIASNFHAESGLIPGINEIKPAPGTRGGYGLAQWTDTQGSPRRTALEAYAKTNNLDVSQPSTQLAFMKQEIGQNYPDLLSQMAAAKTPEEKAAIFYKTYEGGPPRLLGAHTAMAAPFAALPPPGSAPGGTRTATASPAATTPPAASTAPPGVQMGGAPPPPPGGSGAPSTGGIGAALAPATAQRPDIKTSTTLRGPGAPVPPPARGQVSGNVGAMQQGMNLAQATPIVPGTGLTAGPSTIGKPATIAPAPASAWPASTTTIGNYNDTAPATVTPPAQPTQPATAPVTPPQPPGPERVPPTFTPVRRPLPPEIQGQIDNPQIPPQYDTAIRTALTPEALQTAQNAKAAAIAAAQKDARAQGEEFQRNDATLQAQVHQKALDIQQANDTALATRQQEKEMELLRNSEAQTNQLRNAHTTADQEQLKTYQAGRDAAQQQINTIQILRNVEKNMPESGSVILQRHPELLDTLTNMGLPKAQADAMSATDLFQRMLGFLGTQLSQKAAVGAGTARQAEIAQNMSVLPGLATDHNGRQQLMGFLLNLAQYQVNKTNAAEDYYNTNTHPRFKDLPSLFGFERKYGDNPDNAIIPQVPLKPDGTPDQGWASSHVKPGMLFKAPVLQRDSGGKPIFSQDGKPVYRPQTLVQGDEP